MSKKSKKPSIFRLPFTIIKFIFYMMFKIIYGIAFLIFGIITLPVRLVRILLKGKMPQTGEEYESWCCKQLKKKGYIDIKTTKRTGDHGIDIIARAGRKTYAIQCKLYNSNVGNFAIQEAYSGCAYYECDIPVVLTNSYFTRQAVKEAEKLGVQLWEENKIPKKSTILAGLLFNLNNNTHEHEDDENYENYENYDDYDNHESHDDYESHENYNNYENYEDNEQYYDIENDESYEYKTPGYGYEESSEKITEDNGTEEADYIDNIKIRYWNE